MDFFTHEGVSLGEALEPILSSYLQRVLYYLRVVERITSRHPEVTTLIVPHSTRKVVPTSGPLAAMEIGALVDVCKKIGKEKNIEIQIVGIAPTIPDKHIHPKSYLRTLLLSCINESIRACVPQKPLRVFASEYWWHISPFIENMDKI